MKKSLLFFLAIGIFWCETSTHADPLDAIVSIWVDVGGGVNSFGTGFFVASDGRIVTAYHVIQGSRKIRVNHHGQAYHSILVESIAPNLDLATLRIIGLEQSMPFLQLTSGLPSGVENENLSVLGHAAGIRDQRFTARMTRRDFALSKEIRGPNFERLFGLDNIQLIPIDLTIYNGLSGGPLLSSKGVLGVVSGSLTEGGSIAWAIPSGYISSKSMQSVNRPASEIQRWPELSLMGSGWKNLRKRVAISSKLARVLDGYFASVDRLAHAQNNLQIKVMHLWTATSLLRSVLEGLPAEQSGTPIREIDSPILDVAFEEWGKYSEAVHAEQVEIGESMFAVGQGIFQIGDQIGKIPLTQKNEHVVSSVEELLRLSTSERDAANQHLEGLDNEARRLLQSISGTSQETVLDVLNLIRRLEQSQENWLSPETVAQYQSRVRSVRRIGEVYEILMNEDIEGPGQNWRLCSKHGYRIVLPAGWEINRLPERARAGTVAEFSEMQSRFDAALVNRQGISEIDVSRALFLGVGITDTPRFISDAVVENARQSMLLNFRDSGAERRTIGGRQVLVASGTRRIPVRGIAYARHSALVPISNKTLLFIFEMPKQYADQQWSTFVSILESIEEIP